MASRDTMKRDYCMLAHVYEEARQSLGGWFMSAKLDGMRAIWDGGRSRDIPASQVPYMNTVKDARYKEEVICTGLFSRSGNVIHAPDSFLDSLPNYCLDGELWCGNNSFQRMSSIVKDLNPGPEWEDVKYMIFDSPSPVLLFQDGDIRVQGYKVFLRNCYDWWKDTKAVREIYQSCFEDTFNYLNKNLIQTDNLRLHKQDRLPFSTDQALNEMQCTLDLVTSEGGEGVMLRKPSSIWEPKRSYNLLKVKKFQDAEATVTGYTTGRETDKGSKLLGKMGALITNFNGKRLELSGFTDEERELFGNYQEGQTAFAAKDWAIANPEKEVPNWITNEKFPRGSQVTFRFRELTDDGIPKESRYWRKYL